MKDEILPQFFPTKFSLNNQIIIFSYNAFQTSVGGHGLGHALMHKEVILRSSKLKNVSCSIFNYFRVSFTAFLFVIVSYCAVNKNLQQVGYFRISRLVFLNFGSSRLKLKVQFPVFLNYHPTVIQYVEICNFMTCGSTLLQMLLNPVRSGPIALTVVTCSCFRWRDGSHTPPLRIQKGISPSESEKSST